MNAQSRPPRTANCAPPSPAMGPAGRDGAKRIFSGGGSEKKESDKTGASSLEHMISGGGTVRSEAWQQEVAMKKG